MKLVSMIRQLAAARGPAGYETNFAAAAEELLRERFCITRDAMGNLLASCNGGGENAPRLLLTAPMEEPGFVVCGHEEGFLRLAALGPVELRSLSAAELLVLSEPPYPGVIAAMPPHLLRREEMENCPRLETLCLDVGMCQTEAVERISLGTPVVFAGEPMVLGDEKICGPGAGNRGAAVAAIMVALAIVEAGISVNLSLALTVQHGLDSRGAGPVAVSVEPDYALALETGPAGEGPAVVIGPGTHRGDARRLEMLAEQAGLPLRREAVPGRLRTDNWAIQTTGAGCAVSLLRLPVRYSDSPGELLSLADCQAVVALLQAYAAALGEEAYYA